MPFIFRINDLPKAPKNVFALATPHHMLIKLGWEIRQLREVLKASDRSLIDEVWAPPFHAYNCAVTAWHCADWAWSFGDRNVHELFARSLEFELGNNDRANRNAFCHAVAKDSRDVHICRQIANGSKHMKLDKGDAAVRVAIERHHQVDNADELHIELQLFVEDDDKRRAADAVFLGAYQYWENLFASVGYVEGRFISADDEEEATT